MASFPTWTEWRQLKEIVENHSQLPDYSFDRWMQKAKEFGDDVNRMRTKADDEDKKLDQKAKDADKDAEKEPEKKDNSAATEKKNDDTDRKEAMEDAWKKLRQLHRDKLEKAEPAKSGDSSSKSSSNSTSPRTNTPS